MKFNILCSKSPLVLKYVQLLFLNNFETAKLAFVCKDSNKAIDSNKYKTEGQMELGLMVVLQKKFNLIDLKMEEISDMIN